MVELVKGYKLAAFEGSAAFGDGDKLGFRGDIAGVAAFKVLTPSLAQEFGTGAVFLLLNFFHLLGHCRRQRDGKRFRRSHVVNAGSYWVRLNNNRRLRNCQA